MAPESASKCRAEAVWRMPETAEAGASEISHRTRQSVPIAITDADRRDRTSRRLKQLSLTTL